MNTEDQTTTEAVTLALNELLKAEEITPTGAAVVTLITDFIEENFPGALEDNGQDHWTIGACQMAFALGAIVTAKEESDRDE
jgi:hypothetical protein